MTPILLLDGPGSNELLDRLRAFDVDAISVGTLEEARHRVSQQPAAVTAFLLPSVSGASSGLKSALKAIRKQSSAGRLTFAAYGPAPDRIVRKKLRAAGVTLALWEPFDDGTLRFQINRAISTDRDEGVRSSPRAPAQLPARVSQGPRCKDAVLYSLSATGCFLETPRASMEGAELEIEIRVSGDPVSLSGRVCFSNVPGNLQRPNLPLGMGVTFEDLSSEDEKTLKNFVEARLAQLEI